MGCRIEPCNVGLPSAHLNLCTTTSRTDMPRTPQDPTLAAPRNPTEPNGRNGRRPRRTTTNDSDDGGGFGGQAGCLRGDSKSQKIVPLRKENRQHTLWILHKLELGNPFRNTALPPLQSDRRQTRTLASSSVNAVQVVLQQKRVLLLQRLSLCFHRRVRLR